MRSILTLLTFFALGTAQAQSAAHEARIYYMHCDVIANGVVMERALIPEEPPFNSGVFTFEKTVEDDQDTLSFFAHYTRNSAPFVFFQIRTFNGKGENSLREVVTLDAPLAVAIEWDDATDHWSKLETPELMVGRSSLKCGILKRDPLPLAPSKNQDSLPSKQ